MNMWLSTYRDESPVTADDWEGFRDPDQYTYREYCARQDEKEVVVRELCSEFHDRGHDKELNPAWVNTLRQVFTPARYPLHGMQLMAAYVGQVAPSSYITNAACFEAADYVRAVCVIAYRTRELQISHPKAGFVDGERETWQSEKLWQPVRKCIEEALVAYDWSESFAALNLVFRPTIETVFYKTFSEVASRTATSSPRCCWPTSATTTSGPRGGGGVVSLRDRQEPRRTCRLGTLGDKWSPAADEAAKSVAHMLTTHPGGQGRREEGDGRGQGCPEQAAGELRSGRGQEVNREPHMGNWVDVYDDDELWDGDMAGVTVGKEKVLIMRANEKLLAFKDACPHKGTPLSDGDLDDGVLTCNVHLWEFDVASGDSVNPRGEKLEPYPCRLNGSASRWKSGSTLRTTIWPVSRETGHIALGFSQSHSFQIFIPDDPGVTP